MSAKDDFQKGMEYYNIGKMHMSNCYFALALKSDPSNKEYLERLKFNTIELEGIRADVKKLCDEVKQKDDALTRMEIGKKLMNLDFWHSADIHFKKAIELDEDNKSLVKYCKKMIEKNKPRYEKVKF